MTETLEALRSGQLTGAKRLDLAADLTQFPLEILDLADSLEILNLTNNRLHSLPNEFGRLQKLKIAFFSNNHFQELPAVLSNCPNLSMVGFKANQIASIADAALPTSVRWLILTDNQIEQIPASWGRLGKLQKLMLAGNQLRSLPDEMAACQNLELVRLSANQLTSLPPWLLTLPRLSWLAYAGNPFCQATRSPTPSLTEIDWADLVIQNTLGEGASGIIFKGEWVHSPTQATEVAIKVFKGEVTSDGLPADEMRSYIAAGTHPHLVKLLGKVVGHPEEKAGLVFAFVPPNYTTLGNPPSFDSCTRDTYSPDTAFSLPVILQIAQGIAAAAAHLHSQGILHGDLYAHNILVNAMGESLLGDFGAASFYPETTPSIAPALESLEVRAFGCLLEDVLDRCILDNSANQVELRDRLRSLQHDCMDPFPSSRPSFAKICDFLAVPSN
ncbi:MAG TPA: protein kinase [Leptolyngbyaceae cyanobacterium M33_DOE_097]|uniref:Protein kinase n=1 Tax=Oscillatoriales cyanobacterium SpSt-418 TaxID=2282169 RepID=A0A7C3KET0_9CYAN|nr:protein kinase [Leptolyngbyaceae cyanobacterium M33_DOE_097]